MTMDAWHDLDVELDAWEANGLTATLWWRDDDAVAPKREFDRSRQQTPSNVPTVHDNADALTTRPDADRLATPSMSTRVAEPQALAVDFDDYSASRGESVARGAAQLGHRRDLHSLRSEQSEHADSHFGGIRHDGGATRPGNRKEHGQEH